MEGGRQVEATVAVATEWSSLTVNLAVGAQRDESIRGSFQNHILSAVDCIKDLLYTCLLSRRLQ